MDNPTYSPNETLNRNILFDEINRLVFKAKSKSASGYDKIPYGVKKSQKVIEPLMRLFQLILDTNIDPSVWRKAIICPILKDVSSDPRTIEELVSSPISVRSKVPLSISVFYKSLEWAWSFSWWAKRLPIKQVMWRSRIHVEFCYSNSKWLFVAFIDVRKCFDFVDMTDMMLYKL